ncbi:macro domain-containing protein [Clostridium sp.]|uniref:macro domain-containing protein n=1 Tax=Clostridium sp. TaxID=1506 RepID=UPI001A496BEA|nr:macro domain-containing protein [Clostridium sp.]MBK5242683.1 hypothetical protein [Clostridium sp.]
MMINRIKSNCRAIMIWYIKLLASISSALGFISIFYNIEDKFSSNIAKIGVIILILILLIIISVFLAVRKDKKVIKCGDKEFIVKYGDIFEDKSPIKVISVNCCFDTVVNNTLIAKDTLHGLFINKYFENNIQELDNKISESLLRNGYVSKNIITKVEGKKDRYPFGSIAEIKCGVSTYYLLALTEFDDNLNAQCTTKSYCVAINSLMEYYDKHSQGNEISIPLIGTGRMSRLNKQKQFILKTLVELIKMNDDKLKDKLNIIVNKNDKDKISIAEL